MSQVKEANMHALEILRRAANGIVGPLPNRARRSEFSCGDCEMVDRCGRPSADDCVMRAVQVARDPTGYRRRMKARVAFWGIVSGQ
jgi:hypothetical protein